MYFMCVRVCVGVVFVLFDCIERSCDNTISAVCIFIYKCVCLYICMYVLM